MRPHPFENQLADLWSPADWSPVTVAVAVSGGADSTALLRGLAAIRTPGPGRLVVVHVQHFLRGAESDGDAQFVQDLAQQLGLPCDLRAAPISSTAQPDGLESAARTARYAAFSAAAAQWGARYLALAHTADDQAETILHRIVRGTGLAGLAGIPRVRALGDVSLIRPLLTLFRHDVCTYLDQLGQPFREDSTNTNRALTRNRLRHDLLPALARDYNPRVVEALLRLGEQAGEAHDELQRQAAEWLEKCLIRRTDQEVDLAPQRLAPAGNFLVREALVELWRLQQWPQQRMSHAHWHQLANWILQSVAAPSLELPHGVRATHLSTGLVRLSKAE